MPLAALRVATRAGVACTARCIVCGWLELHCTSEPSILAWVAGEKVAKELFSRTLTRLCIVVPTVAVAASVCTLTCADFAVASSSARLLSMRSATWLASCGDRRMATRSSIS